MLLTKVTPGVGLLWFAVRREWRALAIALGVTGAIVAVSLLVNGQLWVDGAFIARRPRAARSRSSRSRSRSGSACPPRPCSWSGARATDRRWTVPLAATLALPVLWVSGFAICAAMVSAPLATERRWSDR